jgi:hypothetical protein
MSEIPGFRLFKSSTRDILVIRLDPEARPDQRDPDWKERTKAKFPSLQEFMREQGHGWTYTSGLAFYPEWSERGEGLYVRKVESLMDDFVYRGWDFGHRFPSCAWLQWDCKNRRLILIRSILPPKDSKLHMPTSSFRDLVKYLSGQLLIEDISYDDAIMEWLQAIEAMDQVPTPPWFGEGTRFVDFSGHEALKEASEVAKESAERNHASILEAGGVTLNPYYSTVKARETAMRDLLAIREDGWPGLIVDPSNTQFIEGMNGGFAYPKASKAVPLPTKVRKDGYYDNIHDSVGYVAVNVLKQEYAAPLPVEGRHHYRRPHRPEPGNSFFHEGRD